MADPAIYTVTYSFTGFQVNAPSAPLPAPQLDNELLNIATSIASAISAIEDIRRTDGALQNGLVTFDSLALAVQLMLDPSNATLVANAVAAAQAAATSAGASSTSAAASAAAALTHALAAAASAASVDLTTFLAKANNLAGLGSLSTSRANLGLGSVAVLDAGVGGLNIPQLDASGKLPAVDGSQLTGVDVLPVGSVLLVPGVIALPGTLKLNGALLSRTTFSRLWTYAQGCGSLQTDANWTAALLSAAFSTGDLSTTFRIPDLRGEFIRGWDDSRGLDSGRNPGQVQLDTLKDHTHTYALLNGGLRNDGTQALTVNTAYSNVATSGVSSPNGGGAETRPRNIPLLACIKY